MTLLLLIIFIFRNRNKNYDSAVEYFYISIWNWLRVKEPTTFWQVFSNTECKLVAHFHRWLHQHISFCLCMRISIPTNQCRKIRIKPIFSANFVIRGETNCSANTHAPTQLVISFEHEHSTYKQTKPILRETLFSIPLYRFFQSITAAILETLKIVRKLIEIRFTH